MHGAGTVPPAAAGVKLRPVPTRAVATQHQAQTDTAKTPLRGENILVALEQSRTSDRTELTTRTGRALASRTSLTSRHQPEREKATPERRRDLSCVNPTKGLEPQHAKRLHVTGRTDRQPSRKTDTGLNTLAAEGDVQVAPKHGNGRVPFSSCQGKARQCPRARRPAPINRATALRVWALRAERDPAGLPGGALLLRGLEDGLTGSARETHTRPHHPRDPSPTDTAKRKASMCPHETCARRFRTTRSAVGMSRGRHRAPRGWLHRQNAEPKSQTQACPRYDLRSAKPKMKPGSGHPVGEGLGVLSGPRGAGRFWCGIWMLVTRAKLHPRMWVLPGV